MRLCFFILLLTGTLHAQAQLESVFSKLPRGYSVDFQVAGPNGPKYTKGSIKKPASLAKIFTAEMGYQTLGSQYNFPVQVTWLQSGSSSKEISDLNLNSYGAPDFSPEALIKLLKRKGVRKVHGEISITGGLHKTKPKDQSQVNDSGYCYNAQPNTLNMQKNCVSLTISHRGVSPSDPDLDMPIKTRVSLGQNYNGSRPHFRWASRDKLDFTYDIQVALKSSSQSVKVDVVVPDTNYWVVNKIMRVGEGSGIRFDEASSARFSHSNGFAMASKKSGEVICESLRDSVNLYSQIIYNLISGSQRNSFLNNYGAKLKDGSGMSHQNRISAQGLIHLLSGIKNSKRFKTYLSCLPQPGKTGSLKTRLKKLKGRLVAKTGSLSGVSHLAGFIKPRSSNTWQPFVFLLKKDGESPYKLRQVQDSLLEDLYGLL